MSNNDCVDENTVIINLGRIYSTLTGINPVLHRVSASGSLDKFGFKDIAKFTIGFFIDPKNEVIIPSEIPDTINGKHLVNWKFLLKMYNHYIIWWGGGMDTCVPHQVLNILYKICQELFLKSPKLRVEEGQRDGEVC